MRSLSFTARTLQVRNSNGVSSDVNKFLVILFWFQNKAATNGDNKYNDNFHGVYCVCKRPYPDPEDEVCNLIALQVGISNYDLV